MLGPSYKIQYRKGTENVAVDALSRRFEDGDCYEISTAQPKWAEEIMASYIDDEEAQKLITQLSLDPAAVVGLQLQDGILRHNVKVWVGSHGSIRQKLIAEMHSFPWGGHSGIFAT